MNALLITHPNTTGPPKEDPAHAVRITSSHLWYVVKFSQWETFSLPQFFFLIIPKIYLSRKEDRKYVNRLWFINSPCRHMVCRPPFDLMPSLSQMLGRGLPRLALSTCNSNSATHWSLLSSPWNTTPLGFS